MKKILAVTIVSLFSLHCMAWGNKHHPSISITNNTESTVRVSDSNGKTITVDPQRSTSLRVSVHEQHGSFPIPSLIMPYVTTITVSDDQGDNSIEIDENTRSITIDDGLELSKN